LLLFDFKTQKWTELAAGTFVNWFLSFDKKYLYCATTGAGGPKLLRIRLADHRVETVTSLKNLRRVVDSEGATLLNSAPDDAAVFTREIGTAEIYALTVRWP
jgi:hypothetical protein